MMQDKKMMQLIAKETQRQNEDIELIASENFVSQDVLEATGSILTNKYAEGYSGKRYYDGCKYIDEIEDLTISRLKKLFNVKYANVQPHSGSQANAAAISALVKPGGKIMGMSLNSGGHLTHGYKINFSGIFFKSITYEVDQNGLLDYDAIEKIAIKEKPHLIICGFSAYSRVVDFKKFHKIAQKVGAKLMADIAHIAGLVATGLHMSPVKYADVITSTTHKTLRGARGGIIMTNNVEIAKKINRWVFPGLQGGPLMHSIAGKGIAFGEALKPEFKIYIKKVIENCKIFAKTFQKLGVKIISNGTDNHLFIINVKEAYNISGKEASTILEKNHITVNKNTIPNDSLSPMFCSGIRVGTAAMTTKGFTKANFQKLAHLMHDVLKNPTKNIKKEVANLIK